MVQLDGTIQVRNSGREIRLLAMSDAAQVAFSEDRESLEDLQLLFNQQVETNRRVAAETAYALAFRYRNEDFNGCRRFDIARIWARRAIQLLDTLPSDTVEQVACTRLSVGGVALPDLLHSGVVRERLNDVLI